MKNLYRNYLLIVSFLLGSLSLTNAQTISPKRGIAGDLLSNADCITADSLSWFYNWANTPNTNVSTTHQNYIEFCPMLWNGSWNPTALNNYLNGHPEVKYLLAFNEPNFNVQANMTPAQAAALWPQVEAIANAHNLKIVSPALGYCSGTCITGYNNMDGTKWFDDFFAACPSCRVDHIAIHVYDTWLYGFKGNVDAYKKYKKPIWVTEFDFGGGTTSAQHAGLMVDVLDYMEKDPDIFRYSWFLTRSSVQESTDIFAPSAGVLTDLGKIYTQMSSYDKSYYHHVNKVIEAEHYISKSVTYCNWNGSTCTWPSSVLLETTTDVSGKLDAYHFASPVPNANDTIYYQVDIPTSQIYSIDFRVNATAASTFNVYSYPSNTLLGTTASLNTAGAWATKTLSNINLAAGKQKIYFTASNGASLKVNWFKINCTSNCGLADLQNFNVTGVSNNAQLDWKMNAEGYTVNFVLEKSTDGVNFAPIGSVSATGVKTYTFTDIHVSGNINYYRIKFVDSHNAVTYSAVKTLSVVTFIDDAIGTELANVEEVSYVIVNSLGQIVKEGNYVANAGKFEKNLLLHQLDSGMYIVRIIAGNQAYSQKIFVNK